MRRSIKSFSGALVLVLALLLAVHAQQNLASSSNYESAKAPELNHWKRLKRSPNLRYGSKGKGDDDSKYNGQNYSKPGTTSSSASWSLSNSDGSSSGNVSGFVNNLGSSISDMLKKLFESLNLAKDLNKGSHSGSPWYSAKSSESGKSATQSASATSTLSSVTATISWPVANIVTNTVSATHVAVSTSSLSSMTSEEIATESATSSVQESESTSLISSSAQATSASTAELESSTFSTQLSSAVSSSSPSASMSSSSSLSVVVSTTTTTTITASSTTTTTSTTSSSTTTTSSSSVATATVTLPSACNGQVRVRKEMHDLTNEELQRLVSAVKQMQVRTSSRNPSLTQHEWYVNIHRRSANVIHNNPVFLPWHRYVAWLYESDLREIDPSVTLPYWNWTIYSQNPGYDPVLSDSILGSTQDENWCVSSGPFAGWMERSPEKRCLRRGYNYRNNGNDAFASPADIQALVIGSEDYTSFENQLEVIHFKPHIWIGTSAAPSDGRTTVGDMGNVPQSPNDFLFYVHHSFVDKVYNHWQGYHDKSFNNYGNLSQTLPYLNKTVQDVLDLSSLCVVYEETKLSPQVISQGASTTKRVKRDRVQNFRKLRRLQKREDISSELLGSLSGVLANMGVDSSALDVQVSTPVVITNASVSLNGTEADLDSDSYLDVAKMMNMDSDDETKPLSTFMSVPALNLGQVKTPQPLPAWMIEKMHMNVSRVQEIEKMIDDRRRKIANGEITFQSLYEVSASFSASLTQISISGGAIVQNSSSSSTTVIQTSSS